MRMLVNDGFVPDRREMETLSVSLDMTVLSFSQVTSTEIVLTTSVLRAMLQVTSKSVPAYKESSGRVTLMLGVGTKGRCISYNVQAGRRSELTTNNHRIIFHHNIRFREGRRKESSLTSVVLPMKSF